MGTKSLAAARNAAHHAAQWLARAARANLAATPDDGHSSLAWDAAGAMLVTQPLGDARLGLAPGRLELAWIVRGAVVDRLSLSGRSDVEAGAWVDARLGAAAFRPASSATVPYSLGDAPARYALDDGAERLGEWFDAAAAVLEAFRARHAALRPGPGPVRLWPHHFDIATLVALEAGNPERVRSVGVGVAMGDAAYAEPYAYLTPWPKPPASKRAAAPAPGHWHTDGFVALVAPAAALEAAGDRRAALGAFVDAGFEACRATLGA